MAVIQQDISAAFNNTKPHMADERVRIANCADDLLAIHHHEVKAVILPRDLPEDIKAYLKSAECERRRSSYIRPEVQIKNHNVEVVSWAKNTPECLQKDSVYLMQLFAKAAHISKFSDKKDSRIRNFKLSGEFSAASILSDEFSIYRPHRDGTAIKQRILTSYSLAPEQNTIWFPGDLTALQLEQMQVEMFSNYQKTLEKYDAQRLDQGDILLMKAAGYKPIYNRPMPEDYDFKRRDYAPDLNALLVHAGPLPKYKTTRLTNVYP